jgi:hypothetical protein
LLDGAFQNETGRKKARLGCGLGFGNAFVNDRTDARQTRQIIFGIPPAARRCFIENRRFFGWDLGSPLELGRDRQFTIVHPMQKFEYSVMLFDTDRSVKALEKSTAELTQKGKVGWELVSVVPVKDAGKNSSYFYFKRLISN